MKTNLTDKDKRLLTFMLMFVIIVAIGYWGVIPQIKRYNELASEIEKEESAQKINKMKLANESIVEMQADEYAEKIKVVKDEFFEIMKSSEVDRKMTELAVKHGLDIYDLKFSIPGSPTSRMAYVNSELYQQQVEAKRVYEENEDKEDSKDSKEKDSSSNDTSDVMQSMMGGEEGGYAPNTDIYAVPITLSVGGELKDLEALLDELNNFEKRLLITSFAWGEYISYTYRDANGNLITRDRNGVIVNDGVTTGELVNDTKVRKSLTVKMELYMCDMTAVDDVSYTDEEGEDETVDEAAND